MDFDDVLEQALELCGEPTGPIVVGSGRWTDTAKARAVNNSVSYIFDVMDEQTEIHQVSTVAGSNIYDLPQALRASSRLYYGQMQLLKVAASTLPVFDVEGMPTQYSVVASDSQAGGYSLILYPTPDQVYELDLVYAGFAKLAAGGTIPLPDIYEDVVIYGTAAQLMKKLVSNKNNNAEYFELERNKLLNQITISNATANVSSNWPHG